MILLIFLIIIGFTSLIFGANFFLDGATHLAKKTGMSELMIGLTVVAFGTSAPELVVNCIAAFENHSEIVYGNIIGSNNFNLFFILGIAALISPIQVKSKMIKFEIPVSLVAVLLLFLLSIPLFDNSVAGLSRIDGLIILCCFGIFMLVLFRQSKNEVEMQNALSETLLPISNIKTSIYLISGLILLIIGGKLVVDNAITLAQSLGVSEKIIGLTIIAAGTSLPELFTSVIAATKNKSDIAIGNVIGSNIFNVLFIISTSALVKPVAYDIKFNIDIYLLLFGTLLLFTAMYTGGRKRLDRWEAFILIFIYIAYIIYQF